MKKSMGYTIGVCVGLFAITSANAQAPAQAPARTPVVEIFGCTFNAGNGMKEFQGATAKWTAWADKNKVTDYTAIVMTPYFHGTDTTNDVLWLGAWPNGTAMGAGEAQYFASGSEVDAAFSKAVKCGSHALYAAVVTHPPKGPPPAGGVTMFTNCTLHAGRDAGEALAALGQWGNYLAENGQDVFAAVLFPLAGERGDAHWNFKAVEGYSSVEAFGKATDFVSSGGFRKADELFSRVVDCDSARVYSTNRVRSPAAPPAAQR